MEILCQFYSRSYLNSVSLYLNTKFTQFELFAYSICILTGNTSIKLCNCLTLSTVSASPSVLSKFIYVNVFMYSIMDM
jgi:hypothetical protein